MGNRCERQKALLQVAHVVDVDRGVVWSNPPEYDDSGIIVLLVKHVHLQNEGGATYDQHSRIIISCLREYLQAAKVDTMNAQSAKKMYSRFIASTPVRSSLAADQ